jgi:hypothetical protein
MMTPRKDCLKGFEKLKDDIDDLDSVNFREHWFYRARLLLANYRCSYRFGILMRLAESHMRKGRGIGLGRITSIPFRGNSNSNSNRGENNV